MWRDRVTHPVVVAFTVVAIVARRGSSPSWWWRAFAATALAPALLARAPAGARAPGLLGPPEHAGVPRARAVRAPRPAVLPEDRGPDVRGARGRAVPRALLAPAAALEVGGGPRRSRPRPSRSTRAASRGRTCASRRTPRSSRRPTRPRRRPRKPPGGRGEDRASRGARSASPSPGTRRPRDQGRRGRRSQIEAASNRDLTAGALDREPAGRRARATTRCRAAGAALRRVPGDARRSTSTACPTGTCSATSRPRPPRAGPRTRPTSTSSRCGPSARTS
jgi:hypothetical protein